MIKKTEEKLRMLIDLPTENGFMDELEEIVDAAGSTKKKYIEKLVISRVKKITGWSKQPKETK